MASYDGISSQAALVTRQLAVTDREQIVRTGRGIISETLDGRGPTTFILMIGGTVYYTAVSFLAGDIVTNITVSVSVAGVAVSLSKVGLYSTAGVLLASSVDQGTAWQSTGNKTIAMQAAYTIPATGIYYGGAVSAAGTTLPSLARGSSTAAVASAAIGSGLLPFAGQLAQADLPAPGTISAGVASAAVWMAFT